MDIVKPILALIAIGAYIVIRYIKKGDEDE